MNSELKNLVFDMGGVLVKTDLAAYTGRYVQSEADRALLEREVFRSVEWIALDRGTITDTEAAASICRRLPERLHFAVPELLAGWHGEPLPPDEMCGLVRELKEKGFSLYLLSNTSAKFHQFRVNIPALRWFDGVFISADCHLLKPEAEIYRRFFAFFGLQPDQCLFIDDSPANVEAGVRAGMAGIVYQGDVGELRRMLRRLGL